MNGDRMDTLTLAERSDRVSRVRSKDTKPELVVNGRDLPGEP